MFVIKYLKSLLYILISLIISSLIIALFSYFNILVSSAIKYFKLILVILSFMIGGLYIGKKSGSKGYIEGLKVSAISILIILLLNLLGFNYFFSINLLILYIIIIISTTLGSIIGINKKRN